MFQRKRERTFEREFAHVGGDLLVLQSLEDLFP
jgi:hypothetical protein